MIKKIANLNKDDSGSKLLTYISSILEKNGLDKTAAYTMYMDANEIVIKMN